MQKKIPTTFYLFFLLSNLFAQVTLSTSNLPILIIETDGLSIPDEPKIPASLKIIHNGSGQINAVTDQANDYDGRIGIELRGQSSKDLFPKRPYGFETRNELGENNNVSLLGMPKENDWVLHNPYSDKSLIRNALTYTLAAKIMDYAPRIRLVEVILNGEYIGVYLLTEKIKRDKNRVNISKLTPESEDITGGYILKFDKGRAEEIGFSSNYPPIHGRTQSTNFLWHYPKADEITDPQADYIQQFINEFENVLWSDDFADPLNGYNKYIDATTFMDFLFINEISRNVDGYRISSFMYKDREAVDGRLKMGPVWDFNLAFGNANYCEGDKVAGWGYSFNSHCPDDFWVIHFWWARLLLDPMFKEELKNRWNDLRSNELSDEVIFGTIDSLENLLVAGAAERNFRRWNNLGEWIWPNSFVGTTYSSEINYLTNWTQRRLNWLDQAFNVVNNNPTNPSIDINIYPNPSKITGAIIFDYTINSRFLSTVKIYNALGQLITELTENETTLVNENKFTWSNLPAAGVYFYNVVSLNGIEFSGKVVISD